VQLAVEVMVICFQKSVITCLAQRGTTMGRQPYRGDVLDGENCHVRFSKSYRWLPTYVAAKNELLLHHDRKGH